MGSDIRTVWHFRGPTWLYEIWEDWGSEKTQLPYMDVSSPSPSKGTAHVAEIGSRSLSIMGRET